MQRNSSSNTGTDFVIRIQNLGTIWLVEHPEIVLQYQRMEALCSTPVNQVGVISTDLSIQFPLFIPSWTSYVIRNTIRAFGTPFGGGFSSNRERPGFLSWEATSWAITHHQIWVKFLRFRNATKFILQHRYGFCYPNTKSWHYLTCRASGNSAPIPKNGSSLFYASQSSGRDIHRLIHSISTFYA